MPTARFIFILRERAKIPALAPGATVEQLPSLYPSLTEWWVIKAASYRKARAVVSQWPSVTKLPGAEVIEHGVHDSERSAAIYRKGSKRIQRVPYGE